jgi:hypothetical protein
MEGANDCRCCGDGIRHHVEGKDVTSWPQLPSQSHSFASLTLSTKLDHEMEVANQKLPMATAPAFVENILGTCDSIPQSEGALITAMATSLPASPTLQGIPRELRDKVYHYLVTTDRTVFGRIFLKLCKEGSGSLWRQFQSSVETHPLSMTCRQMGAEAGPVFAEILGLSYTFVVNNIDMKQLRLYRQFIYTDCFSHKVSDSDLPPFRYDDVAILLKFDRNVFESTQTFRNALSCDPELYPHCSSPIRIPSRQRICRASHWCLSAAWTLSHP